MPLSRANNTKRRNMKMSPTTRVSCAHVAAVQAVSELSALLRKRANAVHHQTDQADLIERDLLLATAIIHRITAHLGVVDAATETMLFSLARGKD